MTTASLKAKKANKEKIVAITAYDYTMARLVDNAGADLILVGDSAANVMLGYDTTLPITLDEMIIYTKGVTRAVSSAMVITDMPFGSYQGGPQDAFRSAVRIMKESGAEGVKIEGGREIADSIRLLTGAGIPVCGHLGLTPQSVNAFGGYGVRAKADDEARRLEDDARLLQECGCFAVVLEKVPAELAARVSAALSIPVIGIGAGAGTDGQIIVLQDMLGMNAGFKPKFLRYYSDLAGRITDAVAAYAADVRSGDFPSQTESY